MSTRKRPNGASMATPTTPSTDRRGTASTANMTTRPLHSPYIPTAIEGILLATYPLTLLLGSLFSHLSPSLQPPFNASTYSHTHQSFQPPSLAPSYFATKRNVFNVYFVKIGWFWVTFALLAFTLLAARGRAAIDVGFGHQGRRAGSARLADMDPTSARIERDARLRRRWQVLLRWGLATAIWALATQWCVGPSLIDRVFSITGGACALAKEHLRDSSRMEAAMSSTTAATCKSVGGHWRGGVDISGHVFLLMLGSGMLAMEVLPVILPRLHGLTIDRVVCDANGQLSRLAQASERDIWAFPGRPAPPHSPEAASSSSDSPAHGYGTRSSKKTLQAPLAADTTPIPAQRISPPLKSYGTALALGVSGLSWWMLLMTAAFFHTWAEKATACLLAGLSLWTIYILPRGHAGIREFIGLPGV